MERCLWYPAEENKDTILNFILWFSRYEYALKNTAYHKISFGFLQPDWNGLKRYLTEGKYPISEELSSTMLYLQISPPKKQTDHFNWKPVGGKEDWKFLIDCLLTVRNNLFHGGKQFPGVLLSPVRDITLLRHCESIMKHLITVCPEHVQIVFETV